MAWEKQDKSFDPGSFTRPVRENGITTTDVVVAVLSVLWLAIAALLLAYGRAAEGAAAERLVFVLVLLAVVTPLALIWVGAAAMRSARILREDSARLCAALDALRQNQIQQQRTGSTDIRPALEKRIEEIAQAQRQTDSVIATFVSTRSREAEPEGGVDVMPSASPSPPAPTADSQPSLALGTPSEVLQPPLDRSEFIRALNFPETTGDREGFRALRRALEDRMAAKLVRSAQDVLTLLSQEGIYMDDLTPDRARPEVWRRFAEGERGAGVSALGGVRDRSCLALTAARMKQDPIFRDVAHHFLRQFDRMLVEFEPDATDQELNDLAETRTARAFMLLGRVTGMFG
ncbi:hypothetical protein [Rhodovulum steppense]|uniref:Uncharacterized protein n=1 Tax=Rhodovulum steppense TaxID=540251 RepID=A0A4R1YTT6_9RHOB|nr:hypothetical protein [Rhodovulum steppense]TCM83474.1 hypothetical protein EV216_11318 [Rhodovulum steppense]